MNRSKQIKKRSQLKRQPQQSHGGHTYESLVLMNEIFRHGEQLSSDNCDVFRRIWYANVWEESEWTRNTVAWVMEVETSNTGIMVGIQRRQEWNTTIYLPRIYLLWLVKVAYGFPRGTVCNLTRNVKEGKTLGLSQRECERNGLTFCKTCWGLHNWYDYQVWSRYESIEGNELARLSLIDWTQNKCASHKHQRNLT